MAEGGLDQMNWRAAFKAVCRVGVPQPVRDNASINPGALSCRLDDAEDSRTIQWLAGAGAEHGRFRSGDRIEAY